MVICIYRYLWISGPTGCRIGSVVGNIITVSALVHRCGTETEMHVPSNQFIKCKVGTFLNDRIATYFKRERVHCAGFTPAS